MREYSAILGKKYEKGGARLSFKDVTLYWYEKKEYSNKFDKALADILEKFLRPIIIKVITNIIQYFEDTISILPKRK